MKLNILLVNPNTLKTPPVIPIGLEYLITPLQKYGHKAEILDLCFVTSPVNELDKKLKENSYDIIGISIRNINTSYYFNNFNPEFFLPEIKELVDCAKKHGIPVILGGLGFSGMPYEILKYLQADFGIIGPGELAFPRFLELWQNNKLPAKVYDGWQDGPDRDLIHLRGNYVDYSQYLSQEGLVGFELQKGCPSKCPYCIEANTHVWHKKIPNVIKELQHLVAQGFNHFHSCDDVFNINLKFSIKFCRELIKAKIPLNWELFMTPYPYNEELFKLLHESNACLITLDVDSDKKLQSLNNYSYSDLAKIIEFCKKYEIKLGFDVNTGYPYETLESTKEMIDFFKSNRPSTVGIYFYYRVYKNTMLAKMIKQEHSLHIKLTRHYSPGENFLEPIYYHQYDQSHLDKLIGNDDLFTINGFKPGEFYQLEEIS